MHDTALHQDRTETRSRRLPTYSEEFVDRITQRHRAETRRLVESYSMRVATAHHAIHLALAALEHGDVDRAVRELRRGGA